jgi:CBS domain-containing protein
MNVAALGARPGRSCSPESSLSEAAVQLRNAPGGLLAVADHGKFLGILTDQDVVRALAQAGASAGAMPVRIFLQSSVPVCRPSDEVRDALRILRTRKVLALPVVDAADLFQGVLSFEDLALAARPDRLAGPSDLSHEDIVLALKSIAAGRRSRISEDLEVSHV